MSPSTNVGGGGGEEGEGGSESDNDFISQDDRRRIMETERLLTESEEIVGDLPVAGAVRRHPGPQHSRRRRKLPEIPKDKKRSSSSVSERKSPVLIPCISALEGVSASIFEELSAATPSWATRRFPGDTGEEEEHFASQVLPPSLILNVVNCEKLSFIISLSHLVSSLSSGHGGGTSG